MYEVAGPSEICGYYDNVMNSLLASGRVQFFPSSNCDVNGASDGSYSVVSRLSARRARSSFAGGRRDVLANVRAGHASAPLRGRGRCALHSDQRTRGRRVAEWALRRARGRENRYGRVSVALGTRGRAVAGSLGEAAGCVAPRSPPRSRSRCPLLEALALSAEAAAKAESVADLFARLEAAGTLLRIDERVTPTMYRCATTTQGELEVLRRIEDVVRLGRVIRLEPRRSTLQRGSVDAAPDDLYVDCTATVFEPTPSRRIFESRRITLQPLRTCQPSFNSALIGHLEATRDDLEEKNRLCNPNPYPAVPEDWIRMFVTSNMSEGAWSTDPEVAAWMQTARVNVARGLRERRHEPEIRGPHRTDQTEHDAGARELDAALAGLESAALFPVT